MRFLADEGIDRSIVDGLRLLGFDVFYVVEQIRSVNDDILLQTALDENRVLITRDKDFGELVYRMHKAHAGVVLVRLEGYTSRERGDLVCKLIEQYQEALPNTFSVIQKGFIRIR
jgi:predicted nuclease of predicted toxin-antitoxin system